MLRNILLVGFGGFLGSIFRYLTYVFIDKNIGVTWPMATLSVNIIGSLVLGLIYGLFVKSVPIDPGTRLLLAVGFCGSFTTFSTFAYENLQMLQQRDFTAMAIYTGASVTLSLLAAYGGFLLGKAI